VEYIYLHGFLSGPASSKGKYLSDRFKKLNVNLQCPDLNGENFSTLTITSQVQIIEDLLDSLSGEVTIVGSSLGGYLATLVAENRPEIRSLVLMAPAFDFCYRYISRFSKHQLKIWESSGYLNLYHYHYKEERKLGYQIILDAQKYAITELTRQIPVLIFHGLNDDSVPVEGSLNYLKGNLKSTIILLNSDHSLLDKLEDIWKYMQAFLNLE
jgi:pimeloyl-ACP methyl ester carboxylesterase